MFVGSSIYTALYPNACTFSAVYFSGGTYINTGNGDLEADAIATYANSNGSSSDYAEEYADPYQTWVWDYQPNYWAHTC
jgi:hypothetical protein